MQEKLESALPEIQNILEREWYKMEIFSWYRDYAYQQKLNSVKVWAHQFWLAIDVHILKNWRSVWTINEWKYHSNFDKYWEHAKIWEEVAWVLKSKWFRWWAEFHNQDTMHFDYWWRENARLLKNNIDYKNSSQNKIYKQSLNYIS